MTSKRPQDEAFLDDPNETTKKQKTEDVNETASERTEQKTNEAATTVSQSIDSVSQPSQSQGTQGVTEPETQGTPVPRKPRAPPKPKTPKTPKKKPNLSVKEINAALKDSKLLPETLSEEDVRAIIKAASRYKCLWKGSDWKLVFTRCWGDKETTDANLQAYNKTLSNVSFHVFSDKFVVKNANHSSNETGEVDWFEFVALKDLSEEMQEIFNEGIKWGNTAEIKVFGSVNAVDIKSIPNTLEVTSGTNEDSFFVSEMETQLNHDARLYLKLKDFFENAFFRRYKYKPTEERMTLHYITNKTTNERLVIGIIPKNGLYFGFYAVQNLNAKEEVTKSTGIETTQHLVTKLDLDTKLDTQPQDTKSEETSKEVTKSTTEVFSS